MGAAANEFGCLPVDNGGLCIMQFYNQSIYSV